MEAYNPQLQAGIMSAYPTILGANKANDVPLLVHLSQAYDNDTAVLWVMKQVLALNEYVGAKAKMSDMQLKELSIQIYLEYNYLNLFELILFFARLRSGEYEDFYSSVDPMRIMKSLKTFCRDRSEELWKEEQRVEKIRRDNEWTASIKNRCTKEQYWRNRTEEQREELRLAPFYFLYREVDEKIKAEQKAEEVKKNCKKD